MIKISIGKYSDSIFFLGFNGAEGRTRTDTAYATAPSRRRVYQFHHFGMLSYCFPLVLLSTGTGTFDSGTVVC